MDRDAKCQSRTKGINTKFLPVKVAYFTLFAGSGSLWTFIPLHMKSLGLTPSEIGYILGVPPFLGAVSTVIAGAVADRLRIHNKLAGVLAVLAAFIHCLLLLIPSQSQVTNQNCLVNYSSVTNVTIVNEVMSFPMTMASDFDNSLSNCVLYYCDRHSNFMLSCNGAQISVSNEASSDMQWNCTASSSAYHNVTHCNSYELRRNKNESIGCFTEQEQLTTYSRCNHSSDINMNLSCKPLLIHKKFELTFWIYMGIFSFANFVVNPIWPLLNAVVYSLLGNQRTSWGRQRLWGTIGSGIVVFPLSIAMHFYGHDNIPSFIPTFTVYFLLTLSSGIVIYRLKGKVEVKTDVSTYKDLKSIARIYDIYIILLMDFLLGFYLTVITTILPLFITNFSTGNEMVVSLGMVTAIFGEVIMMFCAKNLLDKLGYVRCLYLVCAAFTLRFFLYTIIDDPWWILPINLLQGITFGTMFTTITAYASSLTPPALHGTVQGLVSTLAWSFGYGAGSIVAGEMMDRVGARKTFTIFSAISLATLSLYFAYVNIFVHLCTWTKARHHNKNNHILTDPLLATDGESEELLLSGNDTEDTSSED